jgi:Fur family peroxide stress response transcriptional regulator
MNQKKRYSEKRDAIWRALCESPEHPSAEQIYEIVRKQYPEISLGTVYRNLTQFLEWGQVRSVGVVNGRERFDADMVPHPHFICRACGAVIDLHQIPKEIVCAEQVMRCYPVSVEYQELVFHGVCHACQKNETSSQKNK